MWWIFFLNLLTGYTKPTFGDDYICPVGWWKRENRCYRFASGVTVTRDNAIALCAGSHLFIPSSNAEYEAVKAFINSHEKIQLPDGSEGLVWSAWLGCNDKVINDVFECDDGTQFTHGDTVSWWGPNEPDNIGSPGSDPVHCLRYNIFTQLGDERCNEKAQPLCEAPAVQHKRSKVYALVRSPAGNLISGWCLNNHTHRTISSDSKIHCASHCMNDGGCSSFNHHGLVCELNNSTRGEVDQQYFKRRDGCNYYE